MALKHYNLYLDDTDPADQAMIALLEAQTKKRRTGEYLRRALEMYMRLGQQQIAPMPAYVPPTPMHAPPPAPIKPNVPMLPPSSNPAVSKLRSAFMRSG